MRKKRLFSIRRGDLWDLQTNTGILRRSVKSVASGRVSYIDADGRFMQCSVSGFKYWAWSAWLTSADDWKGRDNNGNDVKGEDNG